MNPYALLVGGTLLAAMNASFQHDFSPSADMQNAPEAEEISLFGPGRSDVVTYEPGGIRITLPDGRKNAAAVGALSKYRIVGDFEITVSYELVSAGTPRDGLGAGVKLWCQSDVQEPVRVTFAHLNTPEGEHVYLVGVAAPIKGKKRPKFSNEQFPASGNKGALRLVRSGNVLQFLVSDSPDGEFRQLFKTDFTKDDVCDLRISVNTHGDRCALDVLLNSLTIRAQRLTIGKRGGKYLAITIKLAIGAIALAVAVAILGEAARRVRNRLVRHADNEPVGNAAVQDGAIE